MFNNTFVAIARSAVVLNEIFYEFLINLNNNKK